MYFIWNDGTYNIIAFQKEAKCKRILRIELGGVDFYKVCGEFGARGFRVKRAKELEGVMRGALE
jgi:thiamine pyrophosphate-dependent acetolactate synthase large subunit-like protein